MGNKIKIFVADNQQLIVAGLKSILGSREDFEFIDFAENESELISKLEDTHPDVLIIDYTSDVFTLDVVKKVHAAFPKTKILAITPLTGKTIMQAALKNGVSSYLLKCCDKAEIYDAIEATHKGERFYCSKVLDALVNEPDISIKGKDGISNCEGINISEREIEIIRFIAEGYSNKEIADKLFLSPHTVNTHRKNIMNKLGVSNATGIVLFAVKEQIITPNKFLFSSDSN